MGKGPQESRRCLVVDVDLRDVLMVTLGTGIITGAWADDGSQPLDPYTAVVQIWDMVLFITSSAGVAYENAEGEGVRKSLALSVSGC